MESLSLLRRKNLTKSSGLRDVIARTYKLTLLNKIDELRMYGFRDYLRSFYRFLSLGLRSSDFWKYAKETWPSKIVLKSFLEYLDILDMEYTLVENR